MLSLGLRLHLASYNGKSLPVMENVIEQQTTLRQRAELQASEHTECSLAN